MAVHLERELLPEAPQRHWTCSLPWGLRVLCGDDARLTAGVVKALATELSRSYRSCASTSPRPAARRRAAQAALRRLTSRLSHHSAFALTTPKRCTPASARRRCPPQKTEVCSWVERLRHTRPTHARRPLTYLRSSRFSRFDFPMRSAFQHTSTHESEVQVLKASHNAAPLGYCVLHASTHSVVSGKPHSPMQAISRKPAGSA